MNETLKDRASSDVIIAFNVHTPKGIILTTGRQVGPWAYRLASFDDGTIGWTITHLASGSKLKYWWAREDERSVKAYCEAMELAVEKSGVDPWISDLLEARAALAFLKDHSKSLAAIHRAAGETGQTGDDDDA